MLVATSMVACSDDDPQTPPTDPGDETPEVPETPKSPINVVEDATYKTYGGYFGDYNEAGTGNYTVQLITRSMTWDEEEYTYMGPGELIYLEFNTELAADPNFGEIVNGTYTVAEDDYSLNTCFGSISTYSADGDENLLSIEGGSITVSHTGNIYEIKGTVTMSDNSEMKISFNGTLTFLNRTDSGDISNLESDFIVTGLTKAGAINFGQAFSEESNYCAIMLGDDTFDLDNNIGPGSSLNFGINIDPTVTDGIPTGTYTVTNCLETETYPVGTAWDGYYEPTYAGYYGCWYFFGDYIESAMMSGTLDVENLGSGSYKMTFSMSDAYGHTVTGSYNGNLLYFYNPE